MTSAEQTGFVIRNGQHTGRPKIHAVFKYHGIWWDVDVISARYGIYNVSELPLDEPIWPSIADAETGLMALAILNSKSQQVQS